MRSILPKHAVLVPDSATCVFKGILYDTYHWEQKLYDGSLQTFEMLKRPDTVKVIAIKDDTIVVLAQEQPNQSMFYDIPGGIHDHADEDELQAIKRELLEETGLVFKNWKLLQVTQPHKKIEQFVYMFLATDFVEEHVQQLDAGEKITVQYLPFADAKRLLASDRGRFLPTQIDQTNSISELLALPEYS